MFASRYRYVVGGVLILILLFFVVRWSQSYLEGERAAPVDEHESVSREYEGGVDVGGSIQENKELLEEKSEGMRIVDVEVFQFGYRPDPLELRAGETVTLRFISQDVAHSFSMFDEGFEELNVYIPAQEIVEKTFNVPNVSGEFRTACNVFCGEGHAKMVGTVRVIP